MTFAIAIDLGATFVKGAICNLSELTLLHARRQPFPQFMHAPTLHKEVDADLVVDAVRTLVDELLAIEPDCEYLLMCSQMHFTVLVDADGTRISDAISWMDQRALEPFPASVTDESKQSQVSQTPTYIDVIRSLVDDAQIQELGNELRAGFPLTTLFWLEHNGLLRAGSIPMSLADFVLMRIANARPFVDPTNAAAHGGFNQKQFKWDGAVYKALKLEHVRLPDVQAHGTAIAEIKRNGRSIKCFTPVGDQQAALAGALLSADEISVNLATGGQISVLNDCYTTGRFQLRPYFDGMFIKTITHLPAGRSLNLLLNLCTEIGDGENAWARVAQMAADAPRSGTLRVTLASDDGRPGCIDAIEEQSLSVGKLFRAAFESMALEYHQASMRLCEVRKPEQLVFSGGLIRKLPLLQNIFGQTFSLPFRLAPSEEDTLLGLTLLARSWIEQRSLQEVTKDYRRQLSESRQPSGAACDRATDE